MPKRAYVCLMLLFASIITISLNIRDILCVRNVRLKLFRKLRVCMSVTRATRICLNYVHISHDG